MNTDNVLTRQNALIKQLYSTITNFSKCAKVKRTLYYLETRLETIEALFIEISKLNIDLLCSSDDDAHAYNESDEFAKVDEAYVTVKSQIRDAIAPLLPQPIPVQQPEMAVQPDNVVANQINEFRLPTISIPSFNGKYSMWPSFKNSFNHLVANNTSLSNLQRLHYLKSSLTGDARQLIQHYDIADANYQAAWQKLVSRYDNKQFLVATHLKSLIHYQAHTKETDLNLRSLIDIFTDSINGLHTLDVPTEGWDPILNYLFLEKVPKETHSLWQASQAANNNLPTWAALLTFMENRFRTLEAIADKPNSKPYVNPFELSKTSQPASRDQRQARSHTTSLQFECILCKHNHYLRACPSFLRMDGDTRLKTAQKHKFCTNCLVQGHAVSQCRNKLNCTICKRRHHTLLHLPQNLSSENGAGSSFATSNLTSVSTRPTQESTYDSTNVLVNLNPIDNTVLLATALINVFNSSGQTIALRALIDPGSQVSFITTKAVQRLQLKTISTNARIFGIGQTYSGTSTKNVSLILQATMNPSVRIKSNFLTIPHITGTLPKLSDGKMDWSHIRNLQLADPFYNRSGPIDLLLSAEIYGNILLPGLQRGKPNEPIAQNTSMGWILMGGSSASSSNSNLSMHSLVDIDSRLRSFWESEEITSNTRPISIEDEESERHFKDTFSRDKTGRFVVRMPFKSRFTSNVGASRESAVQRLLQIEKKFIKNPQLALDYKEFMKQYEALGHMRRDVAVVDAYYIPHHPVIKSSSSTTKLRVVFDASHKSRSGLSLNDTLCVGPTIQDDLTTLITRWRKYPVAFCADLEKMYRQIRIHELDQGYQRIVWRDSPSKPILDFKLLTVTYGTACAQFLAIRSLQQLAHDGVKSHPLASQSILEDFYVDDILSGAYDVSEALTLQSELRDLSSSAGLHLRKWASNHDALLQSIPPDDREIKTSLLIEFDDTIKSLGIHWDPCTDDFTFQSSLDSSTTSNTKRTILSEISKLFDPLGWLCPIIIQAKILMQQMWILNAGWDDELPATIISKWHKIREDLQRVYIFSLPRSLSHFKNATMELHGFYDASIHAYAAVVYSRIEQKDKTIIIRLLAAKSKVAPIKQISLPRLELCGAHLLSKLILKVKSDLKISDVKCFAWCDSTIVLQWLKGHPNRLKTFVANRVSEILVLKDIQHWRHVAGKDNPADCASRGLDSVSLQSHDLWWNGPSWLHAQETEWPHHIFPATENLPDVKLTVLKTTIEENIFESVITSHSSLTRLVRIIATIKRFTYNIRCSTFRRYGALTPAELKASLNFIIRIIQSSVFSFDYKTLQSKRKLHHHSNLLSLNPFLDDEQLLRVGGRLQNSNMSFESKHPLIIPKRHHFTKLLIDQTHLNTLHGGPELVITMLRRRYWILSMRSAVRLRIHECTKCFRFTAKQCSQQMGTLPKPRVQIDRSFTHTGVDCAGPINVRMSKGRGSKSHKAYIALFICLSTKAVHIEVVSDMSTPAFIAAYRRFCSRRGFPQHMYSDNGTNFVGASKFLNKEAETHLLHVTNDLVDKIANNGSTWHFIPPSAPHFGGLWEAGIKSMKQHLKRIIGDATLTFEEISTLLTQIEACLNSRPLCPTTSDPSDNSALTPGHFLIGDALLAPPESSSQTINPTTRWQLVQKIKNDFWKRWQREYITRLQNRPKWATTATNLEVNNLVIIMEDNLPPSRWALGRIIETHPGSDGLVRVVSIKCQTGIIKRPISKLALLPLKN